MELLSTVLSTAYTLLIAIVTTINPAIGFLGSTVKCVVSLYKKKWPSSVSTFVLNVVSQFIPSDSASLEFVKNLATGIISDIVNLVVPRNYLALTCQVCGRNTHDYVKNDEKIKCKKCFKKNIDEKITHDGRTYVSKNGIYQIHKELAYKNSLILRPPPQLTLITPKNMNLYVPRQPEQKYEE